MTHDAIVEFMGHVTIVGRIAESERSGTKLVATEPMLRGKLPGVIRRTLRRLLAAPGTDASGVLRLADQIEQTSEFWADPEEATRMRARAGALRVLAEVFEP